MATWRIGDPPLKGLSDDIPFKERIKTVSLGFTEGKEKFHGPTIKERQAQIVSEAKAMGHDPVPVGHRTYAGPVSV